MIDAKRWITIILITSALLVLGSFMDEQYDVKAAAQADQSDDTQAYLACEKIGGPNASFKEAQDGKVICTTKRGYTLKVQP